MARRRRRSAPRRRNSSGGLSSGTTNAVAAVAGGAIGSLVGGLLVTNGVSNRTTSIGVLGVGALGAFATKGSLRYASLGMAAAGAGQLSLSLLVDQQQKQLSSAEEPRKGLPPERNQELLDAYEESRLQDVDDLVAA